MTNPNSARTGEGAKSLAEDWQTWAAKTLACANRREQLQHLAAEDFLPAEDWHHAAVGPGDDPQRVPEFRNYQERLSDAGGTRPSPHATQASVNDESFWHSNLKDLETSYRRRQWTQFTQTWITPYRQLGWIPFVVIGLVVGLLMESNKPRKPPTFTPLKPAPAFTLPEYKSERDMIDSIKAANRKLKAKLGPGKAPDPSQPTPGESLAVLMGLSPAGRKELRDDWFSPNPAADTNSETDADGAP